ncbi:hypothetical protein SSP531S_05850 [Streptomyces spongiicola]|uniref:Uncharacterized protein n=1 Tax=Streptomyces spongiicola TaxID=1690221 RepID=A0A388STT5_9ACTN|nr:hypothetical protein SSP531S_05850 [Streptomyces spongiicola]
MAFPADSFILPLACFALAFALPMSVVPSLWGVDLHIHLALLTQGPQSMTLGTRAQWGGVGPVARAPDE